MSGLQVFRLPDLGEGLTEGEIIEWKVAVGDTVAVDQVVAVVETAKASVDLPCPFAGTVATLHGNEGDIIPVGSAFITVDTGGGGGASSDGAPAATAVPVSAEAAAEAPVATVVAQAATAAATTPVGGGNLQVFRLPDLGEGLTEGEIIEWRVAVGDTVAVDQVVAVVETAKASVDLPCPFAGTVAELHGQEGEIIPVGSAFITVDTGGGSAGSAGAAAGAAAAAPAPVAVARDEKPEASGNVLTGYGTSDTGRTRRRRVGAGAGAGAAKAAPVPGAAPISPEEPVRAPAEVSSRPGSMPRVISPLVRRMAAEAGLALSSVTPTGPNGIILRKDVEAALAAPKGASAPVASTPDWVPGPVPAAASGGSGAPADIVIPLRGVRRAIAEKLATSRREIPDATTWVDVDATGLMEARKEIQAIFPDLKIGVFALVARMVVAGLKRFPELNARIDMQAGTITQLGNINLSFAAQSPRGLMVPVVHGAGQMTTVELGEALKELTVKARDGKLSPAELTGGTFTINNHGVFGTDGTTPIINHPEAGMLAIGRIIDRPWAHDGQIVLRKIAQLSLSFDHRVCDGGVAGGFIRYVADCIEKPGSMLAHL